MNLALGEVSWMIDIWRKGEGESTALEEMSAAH